MAQLANATYTVFVHGEEANRLNKRLKEVNQEAQRRNVLNAEIKAAEDKAKAKETTKAEAK